MNKNKEYIDREAVLTVLKVVFDETDPVGEEQFGILKAHRIVREAPAADVVEVVQCKDCKRSGMYDFGCGDRMHLACLEIEEDGFVIMAAAVNDDDFCSHGERKEE